MLHSRMSQQCKHRNSKQLTTHGDTQQEPILQDVDMNAEIESNDTKEPKSDDEWQNTEKACVLLALLITLCLSSGCTSQLCFCNDSWLLRSINPSYADMRQEHVQIFLAVLKYADLLAVGVTLIANLCISIPCIKADDFLVVASCIHASTCVLLPWSTNYIAIGVIFLVVFYVPSRCVLWYCCVLLFRHVVRKLQVCNEADDDSATVSSVAMVQTFYGTSLLAWLFVSVNARPIISDSTLLTLNVALSMCTLMCSVYNYYHHQQQPANNTNNHKQTTSSGANSTSPRTICVVLLALAGPFMLCASIPLLYVNHVKQAIAQQPSPKIKKFEELAIILMATRVLLFAFVSYSTSRTLSFLQIKQRVDNGIRVHDIRSFLRQVAIRAMLICILPIVLLGLNLAWGAEDYEMQRVVSILACIVGAVSTLEAIFMPSVVYFVINLTDSLFSTFCDVIVLILIASPRSVAYAVCQYLLLLQESARSCTDAACTVNVAWVAVFCVGMVSPVVVFTLSCFDESTLGNALNDDKAVHAAAYSDEIQQRKPKHGHRVMEDDDSGAGALAERTQVVQLELEEAEDDTANIDDVQVDIDEPDSTATLL